MRTPRRGFEFPIPFDPFRLLLAVLENVVWIVLIALAAGALGAAFGWFRLGDTYKAPVRVQKEVAPDSWSDNPTGPYVPRPLGAEALKVIAYSQQVFERAGERHEPPVDAKTMRGSVMFEEITGQDLFEVLGLSKSSKAEALGYATAYVQALIEVTTERRKSEAASARELYASQLAQREAAAERVSKELLELTSRHGVFDPSGQTGSRLQEVASLKLKRQEAFTALEAAKGAISLYLGQQRIAPLQAEIERARRAGASAAVLERELQALEASMTELASPGGEAAVRAMASTLPAVVYRELLRLREELNVAQLTYDRAAERVAEVEEEIAALPDKVLAVEDLQVELRDKHAAALVLEARMKDAEFYAKTPPRPLVVLNTPTLEEVDHRSALSKSLILGGACAFMGGVLALAAVLVLELFRRTVRTPLQAAIATSAVPKLSYPRASKDRGHAELRDFWLRSVGRFLPEERRFLFPVLGEADGEEKFWGDLFATLDGGPYRVVFMDFGERPLDLQTSGLGLPDYDFGQPQPVSVIDPTRFSPEQIGEIGAELPERHVLLVRWGREPDTVLAELCRHIDRYYFITSGRDAKVAEVEYLGGVYRDLLGEADGVVLVDRRQPGRARRIVSAIESWFIATRERSGERPAAAGQQMEATI